MACGETEDLLFVAFLLPFEVVSNVQIFTDRLIISGGNVDAGQLPCSQIAGKDVGIPPVGLYPFGRLTGDKTGGSDEAGYAHILEHSVDAESARYGFITAAQRALFFELLEVYFRSSYSRFFFITMIEGLSSFPL